MGTTDWWMAFRKSRIITTVADVLDMHHFAKTIRGARLHGHRATLLRPSTTLITSIPSSRPPRQNGSFDVQSDSAAPILVSALYSGRGRQFWVRWHARIEAYYTDKISLMRGGRAVSTGFAPATQEFALRSLLKLCDFSRPFSAE